MLSKLRKVRIQGENISFHNNVLSQITVNNGSDILTCFVIFHFQPSAGPKKITVSLSQRSKKKYVTVVTGLRTYGTLTSLAGFTSETHHRLKAIFYYGRLRARGELC